jgi:hypothetical protein
MILNSNTQAVGLGLQARFLASGGTGPYSYSVQDGGIGGTINSSSGVYTAPNSVGVDTILAVDSLGDQATLDVSVCSPLELFCDIIREEMDLDDDQVYLYNQKYNVPTDERIYIAIGILNLKAFGNSVKFDDDSETQSVNMLATLSINILSRSFDALSRKEEVVMALLSTYSQSQQEMNGFYIARVPSGFVNLSEEDGAAIPFRFNISVNMQYTVTKVKEVPYYDTFSEPTITTEE